MKEATKSKLTIDTWGWDNAEKHIAQEKRIVAMLQRWVDKEPPPVPISVNADWGFRVWVIAPKDTTGENLRALVRWFVRVSGKKFTRDVRDKEGTPEVIWWNSSTNTEAENQYLKDEEGSLDALFILRDMPLGNCRIVEKEKTVKVKELVCGD